MKRSLGLLLPLFAACTSNPGPGTGDDSITGVDAVSEDHSETGILPADAARDVSTRDAAVRDVISVDSTMADVSPGPDVPADVTADAFDPTAVPSTLGSFTTQGSAGCGLAGAMTGVRTLSLSVGGTSRTATVFIPADYDPFKAYPVVFVFHGDGGTGSSIRTGFNLEAPAAGRAIFAYPDGAGRTWDATVVGANQDMDLVMAVRSALRDQYCVDIHRTFATGHSRGAFFVNQLACRYGIAEFAAMAPHSGTIDPGDNGAYVYGPPNPAGGPFTENGNYDFMCPIDGTPSNNPPLPALPPPMMVVHGECDTEAGVEFPEGRRSAQHWGFAARCSTTPTVITNTTPGCTPATSCPTTAMDPCYTAPGCANGHDVVFCAIPGMGHSIWCEAPQRIWDFFAQH